jgi:hypothetical protein
MCSKIELRPASAAHIASQTSKAAPHSLAQQFERILP